MQALPTMSSSKEHADLMRQDDTMHLPEKPERQTVLYSTLHLSTGCTGKALMGMTKDATTFCYWVSI